MSLIPIDWYYPLCALLIWGLALILIPKNKWRILFWYGLVWGFLAGYIFAWVFGLGLHLFDYILAGPFKPFGASLWLVFAWVPAIMIYLHNLPLSKIRYMFPLYLASFALASSSLDAVFHGASLLKYHYWNPFFRFIVAIIWFWGAKVHYVATKEAFREESKC